MKHIILFCIIIVCVSRIAAAQDTVVNPTVIQQPMNIVIQNTDVYYCPMEPPSLTDTREQLSNQAAVLRDSNGLVSNYPWLNYLPMTHDTILACLHPCASWPDTLGPRRLWQRLFTARNQPGGIPSDIIAGSHVTDSVDTGMVIISANEDVDFRASGTIKMENGFHVMPGAFFHAYQEPKWGDSVFSDEFNDTAKFHNQWYVANNGFGEGGSGFQNSYDSNATLVTDSDAHDGYALDIAMHLDTLRRYHGVNLVERIIDQCLGYVFNPGDTASYIFSSACLRACPWPFLQRDSTPLVSTYQHAPYGKFEIREKIPLFPHHANNWLCADNTEFDMNEMFSDWFGNMGQVHPDLYRLPWIGPCKGWFRKRPDSSVVFISPAANWSLTNNPQFLFINQFRYNVGYGTGYGGHDTVFTLPDTVGDRTTQMNHGTWPYSLSNSTDTFTFYYAVSPKDTTNSLPWYVKQDSAGTWCIFSAAYRYQTPDSLRFTKAYQPTSVTLTTGIGQKKKLNCHWQYNLNDTGTGGLLWLDDTLSPTADLHSNTEQYAYTVDNWAGKYPIPAVAFDSSDYKYHTFGVEILPHEVRYLIDSNVVYRVPDRMIPPGNRQYNYADQIDRVPLDLRIAEQDMDHNTVDTIIHDDTLGVYSGSYFYPLSDSAAGRYYWQSEMYIERTYFQQHLTDPTHGFWNNAAHDRVDYVKIWDVPADVKIPGLPQ